jgi:hypothetical protein
VAAWTATAPVSVQFDETALALRAFTVHRDDLVKTRTQTVNRLQILRVRPAARRERCSWSADRIPRSPALRVTTVPAVPFVVEIAAWSEVRTAASCHSEASYFAESEIPPSG